MNMYIKLLFSLKVNSGKTREANIYSNYIILNWLFQLITVVTYTFATDCPNLQKKLDEFLYAQILHSIITVRMLKQPCHSF